MYRPIRGQGGHLVFLIGPKTTNLVEDIEFLRHQILFSGVRDEVENVSANGRPRRPVFIFLSAQPQKTNLSRILRYCFLSFHREIPFGSFRGDENVSANQRSGRPSCFSDRPEKKNHSLGRRPSFLSSFVKFCSAVLEKSKMWNSATDGRSRIVHQSRNLKAWLFIFHWYYTFSKYLAKNCISVKNFFAKLLAKILHIAMLSTNPDKSVLGHIHSCTCSEGAKVWTPPPLRFVRGLVLYWGLVGRKGGLKVVFTLSLSFFLPYFARQYYTNTYNNLQVKFKRYMERSYLLYMSPFQIITKIQLPIPGFYERAFSDSCCPKLHHWSLRGPPPSVIDTFWKVKNYPVKYVGANNYTKIMSFPLVPVPEETRWTWTMCTRCLNNLLLSICPGIFAPGLKGPRGASSNSNNSLSVCPSVRNSVPLTKSNN